MAWSWVEAKLKKKQQVAKDKEELGGGGKKHRMAAASLHELTTSALIGSLQRRLGD